MIEVTSIKPKLQYYLKNYLLICLGYTPITNNTTKPASTLHSLCIKLFFMMKNAHCLTFN